MIEKNNIPKFFHRLRKKDQKIIKVGFLFSDFNSLKSIILPYFEVKNEKISKTVFFVNRVETEIIPDEIKEKVNEWINFEERDALKLAQNIYDKKIDVLIVLSDNKFIKEVLNYHAAPVQIAGANAVTLRDKIKNNVAYVDAILGDNFIQATDKIDTIELNSALCYLLTFEDKNAKNKNKNEIIFGAMYDEKDNENNKTIAKILERVSKAKIKFFSDSFNAEKDKINAKKRLLKTKIPEEKIELIPLNNLFDIDIFLDAYKKIESVLLLDMLYNGVVVISMTDIGRSILNAVSLSELGVNNKEDYINIASVIASDRELISGLHSNLKNMMKMSPLMNTEDFAKNIEAVIFASFDYLLSLKDDIPTKQEFNILWDLVYNVGGFTEENKLAIIDRLILTKPTDTEVINFIAVTLSKDTVENEKYFIDYLPENTLAKNFLKFDIAFKDKDFELIEKFAPSVVDYKYNNPQEQYIISTVTHRLGEVYSKLGRVEESAKNYFKSMDTTPDQIVSVKAQRYSDYLFMLHLNDISLSTLLEESKGYGDIFKNVSKFSHEKKSRKSVYDKIRVGYISPDFRQHVVAYFAGAFFEARNKNKFETYAYMTRKEDFKSELFKKSADHYKCLNGLKNDEIAEIIYNDNIDILVDLSGHTSDNSLPILAKKPAPIQITGIGYFATTGLPEVDYFLVDNYIAPSIEDKFFIEKLLRLPQSHLCYTPIMPIPEKNYEAPFNKNNFITFGSMNDSNKINEKVWETWSKILQKVPNSKLFLKTMAYKEKERINSDKEKLKKYDIDTNRVIFEIPSTGYLKKYNEIDIALDTFPYPGGGTTCDALMMNVPVITLSGNSCHERFGKSILCNIGLQDLIANSVDEYINIAVNLANNIPRLNKLHSEIYERMTKSAVMNQKLYMKDLEEAYIKIYEEWQKNV